MGSSSLFGNLPPPAEKADDVIKVQVALEPDNRDLKKRKICEDLARSTNDAVNNVDEATKNLESGKDPAQAPAEALQESSKEKPAGPSPSSSGNQVAAALIKIASHIGQAKKFVKASELLRQLYSQKVLEERHGALVFDALQAAMFGPQRAFDPLLAREYSKLFSTASRHSHLFNSAQRSQLDGYGIWAVVRNEMMTDDSFMFNKVLGNIKKMITELPEIEAGSEEEQLEEAALTRLLQPTEMKEGAPSNGGGLNILAGTLWNEVEALAMRRAALLDCVCTGKDCCYANAWARTSVDLMVDHTKAHDMRFLPSQRARILEMVTFVRDQRAGRKLGPSARDAARDSTSFERARADWGRASVSHRGKVGAGGDTTASFDF